MTMLSLRLGMVAFSFLSTVFVVWIANRLTYGVVPFEWGLLSLTWAIVYIGNMYFKKKNKKDNNEKATKGVRRRSSRR